MAELKTQPTEEPVKAYIDRIEPEVRRLDSLAVLDLMQRIVGQAPKMWGSAIVGFGSYTYTNSTNKPAQWPIVGFAARKSNLTIYIMPGFDRYPEIMGNWGKFTLGKSCLYIKKLTDVDMNVLEALVARTVADMREMYPSN